MRIIHLTKYLPEFGGGMERVTREMMLAGKKWGADVEVIGVEPQSVDRVRGSKISFPEIGLNWKFQLGTVPLAPGFFFEYDRILKADLVHIHTPNPAAELAMLTFLSLPLKRRPLLVPIIHAPILRWPRVARIYRRFQQRLLDASDLVVYSTPQLAASFQTTGPIAEPGKTRILPFGVPEAAMKSAPERKSGEPVRLLGLGRLVAYKGFDLLLDAVADIPGGWHLTILGRGPESVDLKDRIKRLNLTEKVSLVEGVSEEEKNRYLADCDLFVFPSRSNAEAFGLAMAEAFSYRKPVVTTDLQTGVAFLARGGECGAIVPANSTGPLREAIAQLIQSPERRNVAGEGNYQFWRNELSSSLFQERYGQMISDLLMIRELKAA